MIGTRIWTLAAALALFAPCANAQTPQEERPPEPSGAHRLLSDIAHDYVNFFSVENAEWAAIGGTAAGLLHQADDTLNPDTPDTIKAGSTYGNLAFQVPLAVGWWAIGHAANSTRGSEAGRDLLRAQVSAMSWTYLLKYSTNRTRPNGDPRSFPSGHTSAVFATAMVLEQHYGWKLGVPAFTMAAYTGAERVMDGKHWASDVAFGAVIGMLSGRTVTLHVRRAKLRVQPHVVPGGGAVDIHVLP